MNSLGILNDDLERISQFNSLKSLVDNCAFDVEIEELDGVLTEKRVELDRLIVLLFEALK